MQTLKYVIGADRRALVKDVQDFKIDFSGVKNWLQARQYEDGMRQVFVDVANEDGTPFDLTGCNIMFEGLLPDGTHRIMDAKHSVMIDPTNGQFRFDFPKQAFPLAGSYKQAFFRIMRDGSSVTTLEFSLEVLADKVISGIVPSDYLTPFEDLYAKLSDILANADGEVKTKIQEWQTKINELITNLNGSYADIQATVNLIKSGLDALEDKIKSDNLLTTGDIDQITAELRASIAEYTQAKPRIDKLISVEDDFDFTKSNQQFFGELEAPPIANVPMQWFQIDQESKQIYMSQATTSGDAYQTFTLSRHLANGTNLDSMTCANCGHGAFGLQNQGGQVYIWSQYNDYASDGVTIIAYHIVRFKYEAGSTLSRSDCEFYDGLVNMVDGYGYTSCTIDQQHDQLIARCRDQAYTYEHFDIYNISDVLSGDFEKKYSITVPVTDFTDLGDPHFFQQGYCNDDNIVYLYSSHPGEITRINAYDAITGDMVGTRVFDFEQEYNLANNTSGSVEGQGVSIYYDKDTGQRALMVGLTHDHNDINRKSILYAYPQRGMAPILTSMVNILPNYPVLGTGGLTKQLPAYLTKLSNVTAPGQYYISTAGYNALTDVPEQDIDAAWFLFVSGHKNDMTFLQFLTKNSKFGTVVYYRAIQSEDIVGDWICLAGEPEWQELAYREGFTKFGGNRFFVRKVGMNRVEYRIGCVKADGTEFDVGGNGVVVADMPKSLMPSVTYISVAGGTGGRLVRFAINTDGTVAATPRETGVTYFAVSGYYYLD